MKKSRFQTKQRFQKHFIFYHQWWVKVPYLFIKPNDFSNIEQLQTKLSELGKLYPDVPSQPEKNKLSHVMTECIKSTVGWRLFFTESINYELIDSNLELTQNNILIRVGNSTYSISDYVKFMCNKYSF